MSWGGPEFVLAIIAMSYLAWVITSWIRAKHGYSIENEWGGVVTKDTEPEAIGQIAQLTQENQDLKAHSAKLEQQLEVLERIVTDPSERTSRAIDDLR